MNELIAYAQSIITYLEQNGANLNIESQRALGDFLQNILMVIEQNTSEQNPVDGLQATPQQPELQQSMPSSNIFGFNYDYDTGNLLVKFQGDGASGQGPVYSYEGVPRFIFDTFKRGGVIAKTTGSNKWGNWWKGKSPSIGAAMHALIKDNYPYQRVS